PATLTAAPSPLPPTPVPPTPPAQPVTLPPEASPAMVIRKGDASRKIVAFSFDAGADAGFAAQILDALAANGIHASFGMTGRWAERNPELLQRMVRDGHHLINHTYDHASMTGAATKTTPLTREQRWEELDRTEAIVGQLTGATTKPYFRPPYGAFDASVNEDVGARGYAYNVLWTVDSRGCVHAGRDGHGDSPGDRLEMGDAAGWVLGAAALEPAAGGFVFGEEQDLQIALVDEVQEKVEDVVDAEVVEIHEGIIEQERDRFGHRAHVLSEAHAEEQVGGRLRALAQDVDVDETARFGNFGGHAEGGRVEHGLLVTA